MVKKPGQSGVSIEFIQDALDSADLRPIVEEIQPAVGGVEIGSRRAEYGVGGGIWPEPIIALTITIAAHGFLSELGKDLYRAFRTALFAAYNKARAWVTDQRYRVPLTIYVRYDTGRPDTGLDPGPIVFFSFAGGMDFDTFELALQAVSEAYRAIELRARPYAVIMEFDDESGSWKEVARH